MDRITVADASRGFENLIGRVAAGEEVAITSAGQTIAVIAPAKPRMLSAEQFAELVRNAAIATNVARRTSS